MIVHDTTAPGAAVCHDPCVYGAGQLTTGAAGAAAAIRSSRAGDQGPNTFEESLARTRR